MNSVFWILWFLNGFLAYTHIRRDERQAGKWTQFERLFWLPTCLAGGTMVLLMFLAIDGAIAIGNTTWAKREAKW